MPISYKFISQKTIIVLTSPLIFFTANVFAAPCTLTNLYSTGEAIGECIGLQPHDNALVLRYTKKVELAVPQDISAGSGFSGIWQDITFKGIGAIRPEVDLISINDSTYKPDGQKKTITSPKITLENINLDTEVVFKFDSPNNEFIFKDASISWSGYDPIFYSGTHTNIVSEGGTNQWIAGANYSIAADITLNVKSGSSFEFFALGGTHSSDNLKFDGNTVVNVENNARLLFNRSGVDFGSASVFNIDSGGAIEFLDGGNVTAGVLNLDQAELTFGLSDMTFTTKESNVHSSTLNLSSSIYDTKILNLSGDSTITGLRRNERLITELLKTKDNSQTTLTLDKVSFLLPETLFLSNNLTIDLNESTLWMKSGTDLRLNGGTINVNESGVLRIDGSIIGSSANIKVDKGSLDIAQGAELKLAPGLNVSLTSPISSLTVEGKLTGSGVIGGSAGEILIGGANPSPTKGILSPGTAASPFGTITIDHYLQFTGGLISTNQALIDTGLLDGGYYDVDIGMTGGTVPINDKVVYGSHKVDITLMKSVRVDVADKSTAAQLDQQAFRIIEASGAGVTGAIVMKGQSIDTDLTIEEGPNVPVLIDFVAINNRTNGEDDITLYAEEQLPITLQKHPGVVPHRNTQSGSRLFVGRR